MICVISHLGRADLAIYRENSGWAADSFHGYSPLPEV